MKNKQHILNAFRERFSETEDTSGIYKIPTYQIWVHDEPYKIDKVNGKKVKDLFAYGSSMVRLKDIEDFLLNTLTEFERETLENLLKEYERVQKDLDDEYKSREDYQPNYLGILKTKIELLEKEKHTPKQEEKKKGISPAIEPWETKSWRDKDNWDS